MTIRVRKYYAEENEINATSGKTLPNSFSDNKKGFFGYVCASGMLHAFLVVCVIMLSWIMKLLGIMPLVHRAEVAPQDLEFVLTEKEDTPINPKTAYKSDRNSRAGGIHDPARKVEMPSPSPAPQQKPAKQNTPAKAPSQKTPPPKKQVVIPHAPVKKATTPAPLGVSRRPSKPQAPSQRPVLKPSHSAPRAQAPRLAAAPNSPFKVTVPKTNHPVGKGFSTGGGTTSTGGGSTGLRSGAGRGGMPAPQFSTTRTANAGTGGSRSGTGRGGYGTGNMGNPGPGNRSGAPGIDAVRTPQWGPYMRELENRIKRNWHPPKGDQSKRVVLLFKIGKRGELLSVKVTKSSGSPENDRAAMQAVRLSAPFRALPPEYTGSSAEIDFTFDYNVLGASYR